MHGTSIERAAISEEGVDEVITRHQRKWIDRQNNKQHETLLARRHGGLLLGRTSNAIHPRTEISRRMLGTAASRNVPSPSPPRKPLSSDSNLHSGGGQVIWHARAGKMHGPKWQRNGPSRALNRTTYCSMLPPEAPPALWEFTRSFVE